MSEINKNDISYLGFDWVGEVKDAILEYLDNEILKCKNELPDNVEVLIKDINKYLGGSEYPEVVGYLNINCYNAIVSNMDLVELMFDDWGTDLGDQLRGCSLWDRSPTLGVILQNYLVYQFLDISDDDYLNYTSSINPQVQVEGLQQAIINKTEDFIQQHKEDIKPIIPNPLDMPLEEKEMLIEGFREQGLSKRLGLSNEDNFLVPKQESLSSRSTQAKQISDEQQHSQNKEKSRDKDDKDKGLPCQ